MQATDTGIADAGSIPCWRLNSGDRGCWGQRMLETQNAGATGCWGGRVLGTESVNSELFPSTF